MQQSASAGHHKPRYLLCIFVPRTGLRQTVRHRPPPLFGDLTETFQLTNTKRRQKSADRFSWPYCSGQDNIKIFEITLEIGLNQPGENKIRILPRSLQGLQVARPLVPLTFTRRSSLCWPTGPEIKLTEHHTRNTSQSLGGEGWRRGAANNFPVNFSDTRNVGMLYSTAGCS